MEDVPAGEAFGDWVTLEDSFGDGPRDKAFPSKAPRGVPGANGGLLAALADPGNAGLLCKQMQAIQDHSLLAVGTGQLVLHRLTHHHEPGADRLSR